MDDQIKIRIKPPHDRIDDVNDQTDIKFIKQKEFNANIVKRLEKLEDKILKNTNDIYAIKLWKQEAVARFDQGVENRTKAFEKIEVLEKQVSILKDLLDRYFTLEINAIEKSHGKRK